MNNFIESNVSLEKCPALVLNADYRPLSYYPLSLWSWQDTVKSVFDSYVTPADEIEDLNRRGAYMHVLADALVSVLILIALILGMLFPKLAILDPLIGIIGGVIIARWALSLITESKNQLLGID